MAAGPELAEVGGTSRPETDLARDGAEDRRTRGDGGSRRHHGSAYTRSRCVGQRDHAGQPVVRCDQVTLSTFHAPASRIRSK